MNDLKSISDLFERSIFRIPDYQRGYAWGDKQLEDFWEDIMNLNGERYHYTGMLSLKKLKEKSIEKWEDERWIINDKSYDAIHVVDGQQRLTTFIILINSIINFAYNNNIECINGDPIEDIKSRYIVEFKKPEMIQKAYKFGYEIDNPSFNYLRYNILGEKGSGDTIETFYTLNLEKAKLYFDDQIEQLYINSGIQGIESLFEKIVNRLLFNIHFIEDDFDVFVAFETMNNRGKKLSNLEILKNRLIYLTTLYDDSLLDKYAKNQLRKNINDSWKEVYLELGRNKLNVLNDDAYLQAHWTLFFKYTRNKGDDYIKYLLGDYFTIKAVYGQKRTIVFEENENEQDEDENENKIIEESSEHLTPSKINEYVESLKNISMYWYYSFNPEQSKFMNPDEIKWVQKLNRIGIGYFRTLVVASFANDSVSPEQRISLFKVIEKTIFVFFRMAKYQSTYQKSVAYTNARELLHKNKNIDDIIKEMDNHFQDNKTAAIEIFINKISILFKNYSGYYSWNGLKYFLFEYEAKLYEKTFVSSLTDWNSFTKNEKDKISIEHIFPQTPNRWYWRNQFRNYFNETERHCLSNSLGNLLALSQSVNSSLQNDEYYDKREGNNKRERGYKNGSQSEIEVANSYNDWNPESIKQRGLKLLDFMESRWNFSFSSYETKLKVLGISFIDDGREEIPELVKMTNISRTNETILYLNEKESHVVDIYDAMVSVLLSKIPDIKEEPIPKANYLAIKDSSNNNIAEVRFVKKTHLARINIYESIDTDLRAGGEYESPSSNWVHKFRVKLRSIDDIDFVVKAILDSYDQH